ncbi:fatty acid desaturase, partial [Mycobacterium sp.]|uniref:fatty acid desaturase n=1 Tax=Mycobacterium sp. TaxID=1785 RepID=UPI0025DE1A27
LDLVLPPDHKIRHVRVPWLAEAPLYLHLPLLVGLWVLFALRLGGWTGHTGVPLPGGPLSAPDVVGMVLSVGLIGAIPTLPIAHELMHRRARFPILLSKFYDTLNLETNADTGHVLGHHLFLDTPADSDTPVRGQWIYSFMWQAWWGKRRSVWQASVRALRKRGKPVLHPKNPIYAEIALLAVLFGLMFAAAGPAGVGLALAAMVFSMLLSEGFNYGSCDVLVGS